MVPLASAPPHFATRVAREQCGEGEHGVGACGVLPPCGLRVGNCKGSGARLLPRMFHFRRPCCLALNVNRVAVRSQCSAMVAPAQNVGAVVRRTLPKGGYEYIDRAESLGSVTHEMFIVGYTFGVHAKGTLTSRGYSTATRSEYRPRAHTRAMASESGIGDVDPNEQAER